MFSLFYNKPTIRYSSYINRTWLNIQEQYNQSYQLFLVKSYLSVKVVSNEYILNKLLKHLIHILPNESLDSITIMSYLDIHTNDICRRYGIVNISSKGRIHSKGIYSDNNELFISTSLNISENFEDNWKTTPTIELIHHPNTNLTISHPLDNKQDGLYMYYIDFKLFYLQYRLWSKGRDNIDTRIFLNQIVLPLLIPSIIDMSIINRYIYTYNNIIIPKDNDSTLIHVNNYESVISKLIVTDLKNLADKNINYIELLSNMSVMFKSSMYQRLKLIDYLYSNNNKHILWLSRIDIIEFIFSLLGDNGVTSNSLYVTMLQNEISMLSNSKVLDHLPTELQTHVYTKIDSIDLM